MPILKYLFGAGGALLCLMFVLNAYVPKAPQREQHDIDKSTIHLTAAPTGDFVIDHFPAVRGDLADAPNDAVRKAMAMMPPEDAKQAGGNAMNAASAAPVPPRKRHLAQRPQSRLANGDPPSPIQALPSNSGWSNNGWSQGWSNNSGGNWNSNWPQNWGSNRRADNR
jgi:hypothetical protein